MLQSSKKVSSPSRTYVAICNKTNFNGNYFRKFVLPEAEMRNYALGYELGPDRFPKLANNAEIASWYFLNRVSLSACIDGVVTWEDFQDCKDESQVAAELAEALEAFNK